MAPRPLDLSPATTSAEACEFGIKRGSPVVFVHTRRFAADDTVLEYSELIARADTRVE